MSDRPASTDGSELYCEIAGLPGRALPSDLTPAGIFVQTTTPAQADREVEIFLRSVAGSVTVQAHVVHVVEPDCAAKEGRTPGFGALFTHLSDEARAWIDRTLASVRARPQTAAAPPPASPAQGRAIPAPGPEIDDVLVTLERKLRDLRVQPAWGVLGVERDASLQRAREAYLEASRRYHPHRFARYDSSPISKVATELFVLHQQAFRSLERTTKERERGKPTSLPAPDPRARETANFPLAGTLDASDPRKSKPPIPSPAASRRVDTRTPHRAVPAPHIVERLANRTPAQAVPAPTIADRLSTRTPAHPVPAPAAPGRVPTRTPAHPVPAPRSDDVPTLRRRPPTPLPDEVASNDDSERPTRETLDRRVAEAELAVATGLKHLALHRLAEATASFGQALGFDATNEQAHLWLLVCQARAFAAEGRVDLAKTRYEAVLALDPKHREALRETGLSQDRPTLKRKRRWFGGSSE